MLTLVLLWQLSVWTENRFYTLEQHEISLLSQQKWDTRQSTEKEMSNNPEELYKVYFHCKMTNSWDDLHGWKIDSEATSKITPYCQQTCACSSAWKVRGFAGKLYASVGASLFALKRRMLLNLYLTKKLCFISQLIKIQNGRRLWVADLRLFSSNMSSESDRQLSENFLM